MGTLRFLQVVVFALGIAQTVTGFTKAVAQPLDLRELGAPSFTTFSTRLGVPDTVAVTLCTDAQGYVWLGTAQGPYRYDGEHWVDSGDARLHDLVQNLFVDANGTVWASFRNVGLAHHDAAGWHLENRSTGLPSNSFRRVAHTRDQHGHDELWALSFDHLLLQRVGDHWQRSPLADGLPHDSLLSIARTRTLGGQPRLWIGTGTSGLWYRQADQWRRFAAPGFDVAQIEDLRATHDAGGEALWISTYGGGLWRLDVHGLRSWTQVAGDLHSDELYDIVAVRLPDGTDEIWASSRDGLVRVLHDRVRVFDRRDGLPSDVVRGLSAWRSPDGVDVLWLATETGVARALLGGGGWHTASLMGARDNGVFGVLVEPDGAGGERVWATSTGNGVGLYQHGQWRFFTRATAALASDNARLIKRAPDLAGVDTLWLGVAGGDLMRWDERERFQRLATPWPHDSAEVPMDVLGRDTPGGRELWVALRQGGVYRLDAAGWRGFRPDGLAGPWRVVSLAQQRDRNGRSWLWASSANGLARYDGTRWELLDQVPGLAQGGLLGMTLIADAQGHAVLWIGSGGNGGTGLVRVDVDDPLHPRVLGDADLPPAPDRTIYSATPDAQGRIYLCSNNGVQLLTPQAHGYRGTVFRRRDGLLSDECNTNAQFVDAYDRFWTGTLGGLTVYTPDATQRDTFAKPLRLVGLAIDGHARPGTTLRVPPGSREVRVDFALLSWQREDESRFRSQLLGFEDTPTDWSAQSFRNFSTLPPGHYTLHVEARDYAGNPSTPLDVAIDAVPYWWQTRWAQAAFAAAIALLLLGMMRWRTRALRQQRHVLETRIAARTLELNHANAQLLELSYRDALTGLANRRRLTETLLALPAVEHGSSAALIIVDVDYFKAYNDEFGHPAGDEALRIVAQVMNACAPAHALVARQGGEEFACLLHAADIDAARVLAERMRVDLERQAIAVPGTDTINHVTLSAGVAAVVLREEADVHRLLREADQALYRAKREGRNCVRS